MSRETASRSKRKPAPGQTAAKSPAAKAGGQAAPRKRASTDTPQVSTLRYGAAREPEPEINIVNLSDTEYVLLQAVRELGAGKVEVVVQGSRIVEITRSQRVAVEAAQESWS